VTIHAVASRKTVVKKQQKSSKKAAKKQKYGWASGQSFVSFQRFARVERGSLEWHNTTLPLWRRSWRCRAASGPRGITKRKSYDYVQQDRQRI
jgi:hypothetical protein